MFLKSLEIRGFKSFADKTELRFKNGVTAVVGPNGSGKSNISDAVRWVLGEQSIKSLRGGKMEDVIFAGTQYRKPVGLAQVSLTLDNNDYMLPIDYSDVTISRRLYRSGESEYYINNTHCRLKDIQELLMDTGIGKEGYSIIGQGKIEAILSGRPEERRNLLEEAAGIVKFKSRKDEAEKKLSNTEQNLLRINDILSTYEERIEPLRIENEKAKKFIELSGALKVKEIAVILHMMKQNEEKLLSLTNKIKTIENELIAAQTNRERIKQNIEKLNSELELHEKKSSDDKDNYYNFKNTQQDILSENQVLNERVKNLEENILKYEKEENEQERKIIELNEQKLLMENEVQSIQENQRLIDDEIRELEQTLENTAKEISTNELNLNNHKEIQIELVRTITEIRNIINSSRINNDNYYKRQEQLKTSYENYLNSLKINSSTISALEQEEKIVKDNIADNEENIRNIKKEMASLNRTIGEKELHYKELTSSFHRLEANYNMLQNLEKQYEGYNRSVKNLMVNIDNNKIPEAKNNTYVLGNIIKVEDKFITAIEIALGGAISDVITKNDDIAKKLIEHLKVNNLGRATFLPLNIIQGKKINVNDSIRKIQGFIGIASELITFDTMFSPAINYVLGRTLIADTMNNALNIANNTGYSYKIVTLSGEVVNAGGSLTGGSVQHKGTNIIGRKKEIEDTGSKLQQSKEDLNKISIELEKLRKLSSEKDNNALNLRDDIHYKQIEITKIQGKISSIVQDSEKLKQNIKTILGELSIIDENISKFDEEIQTREIELKDHQKKESDNKIFIEELQKLVEEKKVSLNQLKDENLKLKIKKAKIDETVSNRIKDLERFSRELDAVEDSKSNLQKELLASKESIRVSRDKIASNEQRVKEVLDNLKLLEDKFKDNEVTKIKLKDEIKKFSEALDTLVKDFNSKEEEKHRLEISIAKYEMEEQTLLQKINDEYNMTLAEAEEYNIEIDNPDEAKKEIALLKNGITTLGVVNLGSIEEYQQLMEKYNFMTSQKNDLTEAKNDLLGVIEEMTLKMKEVFNDNFNKLRVYFNETFRELFKGGSADLILGEGDELTANIDINVQPPGKKLQNINLMSGGEKGLSAIALLFSILKMKPTPFCILDEIEAALDDANVARYAEFLKDFSDNIQFIVITHRKGTMEASDILYGVTMEEKGISKIVSVDLNRD